MHHSYFRILSHGTLPRNSSARLPLVTSRWYYNIFIHYLYSTEPHDTPHNKERLIYGKTARGCTSIFDFKSLCAHPSDIISTYICVSPAEVYNPDKFPRIRAVTRRSTNRHSLIDRQGKTAANRPIGQPHRPHERWRSRSFAQFSLLMIFGSETEIFSSSLSRLAYLSCISLRYISGSHVSCVTHERPFPKRWCSWTNYVTSKVI